MQDLEEEEKKKKKKKQQHVLIGWTIYYSLYLAAGVHKNYSIHLIVHKLLNLSHCAQITQSCCAGLLNLPVQGSLNLSHGGFSRSIDQHLLGVIKPIGLLLCMFCLAPTSSFLFAILLFHSLHCH